MASGTVPGISTVPRQPFIDWLRVFAVLLLVPFHTARLFDIWEPFYAKSETTSQAMSLLFIATCGPWHMPLLFALAGASTWHALRVRGRSGYLRERVRRLLLPLVFGVLVVVPPQSWCGALTNTGHRGGFLSYYPQFFTISAEWPLTGYMGGFTPGHLWFVLYLFVISCVMLPVVWRWQKDGERGARAWAAVLTRPACFWAMPAALMLAQAIPDIGGKNIFYYTIFFLSGALFAADAPLAEAVEARRKPALAAGAALLLAVGVCWWLRVSGDGPVGLLLDIAYEGIAAWCLVIAALGYGKHLLGFSNRFLRYAAEAAYPFYILHQTVIVLLGMVLLNRGAGIWAEFLIICVLATAATAILYAVFVKPWRPVRFLFGMKP